ncbi:MAG: TIGR03905 family TSCPD domain-containing protein [Muribaculaceae bacterium]|nr:TIGR03905 family TSCPD domain-containing protein [Muribaculaceae bacterium]
MKQISYSTTGTCSKIINITLDGDVIRDVQFVGGCPGNTYGIATLVRGMKVDDVISRFSGISCGIKSTSCPDQLAHALRAAKQQPEL